MVDLNEFISEKLNLSKVADDNIDAFWFSKNAGIRLPITLRLNKHHSTTITIDEIELSPKRHYHVLKSNGDIIALLNDLAIKCLFEYDTHTALINLQNREIEKLVGGDMNVMCKFNELDKIIAK